MTYIDCGRRATMRIPYSINFRTIQVNWDRFTMACIEILLKTATAITPILKLPPDLEETKACRSELLRYFGRAGFKSTATDLPPFDTTSIVRSTSDLDSGGFTPLLGRDKWQW
jgi:hypothetical protein